MPSIPDHMLQGHLIVWNNVPGGQNDYFEQKGPQTDIHCSKYSLNIAQDPTYPSIWKYLSRNIFDHQRNSFLSNVPGGQNGKVYQCDSLVTLGKLDIKIHQDQSHRSHHCCHRPAHRVLQHKRTSPPGSQGFPPWFQDCIISRILAM